MSRNPLDDDLDSLMAIKAAKLTTGSPGRDEQFNALAAELADAMDEAVGMRFELRGDGCE
jgi:hypothetical protein